MALDKILATVAKLFRDAFPETHWRRIQSKHSMERPMREIRTAPAWVGAFPDG